MMIERFNGAAVWASLGTKDQAAIGAAALELVAAWHLQECVVEDPLHSRFALLGDQPDTELIGVLQQSFAAVIPQDLLEAADGMPLVPSLIGPICRCCGCTENNACEGGCGRAEDDLCTACAAPTFGMTGVRNR